MSGKRSIDFVETPEQSRNKLLATIEPHITLEGPDATLQKLVGLTSAFDADIDIHSEQDSREHTKDGKRQP
jgi:hypothetical protein